MARNTSTETELPTAEDVIFENATIGFRNFEGKESQYNRRGARNFCVFMPEEQAEALAKLGWNIKRREPREDGGDPEFYLKVNVKYDGPRPPKVTMLTKKRKTLLDEATIANLDWAEIVNVDFTITAYSYEIRGETGISAYLKTMYVQIVEDELEEKYSNWGEN